MLDAHVRSLERGVDHLAPENSGLQRPQDGTEIDSREFELMTDHYRNR